MFLRRNRRIVEGETHECRTLVRSVRTARGPRKAGQGSLTWLWDLYRASPAWRALSAATRKQLRNELSRPIVESIGKWATQHTLLPGSALRVAIEYMNDHWKGLQVFLDDPYVPLDTNLERLIRAIAVGRKNF